MALEQDTCQPLRSGGNPQIEIMLMGSPRPVGSADLDPARRPAALSVRQRKNAARGPSVFFGAFKTQAGGSPTYWWMHCITIHNDGSRAVERPDSAWDTDGWRSRRWFTPADAYPVLKSGLSAVLDVVLVDEGTMAFAALSRAVRKRSCHDCCFLVGELEDIKIYTDDGL